MALFTSYTGRRKQALLFPGDLISAKKLIPKAARNEAGMYMLVYEKWAFSSNGVLMLKLNNETKDS